MKKISILLFIFISIFFAQSAFAQFSGAGAGTTADPYQITTPAQLDEMRNHLNKVFILNNDIDLSGYQSGAGWVPIGNETTNFAGKLRGHGKRITNLKISNTALEHQGLFGFTNGAEIDSLGLENAVVTSTFVDGFTGSLIGLADANTTISNCYSTGVSVSGTLYVGGFVGGIGYGSGCSLSNCYSGGSVTGGSYIGGLVGANNIASISNCYSTAAVTGGIPGGFMGYSNVAATACFWDTETSGQATSDGGAGVVGKTTAEMKTLSTFTGAGWNFTTVWEMIGTNYPTLRRTVTLAPIINLSGTSINFGTVLIGSTKKDSVLVSNSGNDTLRVTNISSTNARFSFAPATITLLPAASTYLVITFGPQNLSAQSGSINLTHNASGSPSTISVSGQGNGIPNIALSGTSINYGTVAIGSTKKDSIQITNSGTDTLHVTNISSTNARFSFAPATITLLPAASTYLVITFGPLDLSAPSGSINLTHNASGSPSTISVSGQGGGTPNITLSKVTINYGTVVIGSTKKDSVLVSNSGNDTLRVTNISSTNARFSFAPATMKISPSESAYLVITFGPQNLSAQSGSIILTHNASGSPDTVAVSGQGSGVPNIALSKTTINYGTVLVGTTKKDSVQVTNSGTDTLRVTNISSTNARFSFTPATITLLPAASTYLVITYGPQDVSVQSGSIILTHNASGSPDTVAVSGQGSVSPVIALSKTTVNYGTVLIGSTKKDSVLVSNSGNDTLRVTNISSTNARFTFAPATMKISPAGSAYLVINFVPQDAAVQFSSIILTHNASGSPDTVTVSGKGTATLAPICNLSRTSIDYGTVIIGATKKDSIQVANSGTDVLYVTNISSSNARFSFAPATITLSPSEVVYLVITYSPQDGSVQSGSIILTHNASGSPSTIAVSGKGSSLPAPDITLSTTSINFGTVSIGITKKDSVQVTNSGTDTLRVTNISSTNARFSFAPASITLLPAASTYLVITYGPQDTSAQSGSIILTHNAPGSPDTVAVNGKGVSAVLVENDNVKNPTAFMLRQNYPNPFNPSTKISFSISITEHAKLTVFNLLGQQSAVLFDGIARGQQEYVVSFDASRLAGGVYFYRLTTPSQTEIRRMLFLK